MATTTVALRTVAGTQAALGWADGHTIVVDRPVEKAGGLGLGFNGAQLLALAIGGCFCNDLRFVAHEMNIDLGEISVSVTVELEGAPLIATSAMMDVACETRDGSDPQTVIERAKTSCMVSNSLQRGLPVSIRATVPL